MAKDIWPIALLLFAGVLTVWLGVAGPVVNAALATGWYSVLQQWQTLISACVALFAAWVAWRNVGRQLRLQRAALTLTLLGREEDRLERELPGLREAYHVLSWLHGCMNSYITFNKHLTACKALDDAIPRQADTTLEQSIHRLFPTATDKLKQEICEATRYLFVSAQHLRQRHQEAEELTSMLAAASHAAERKTELEHELSIRQREVGMEEDGLREYVWEFDKFVSSLGERIKVYENRLAQTRALISNALDEKSIALTRA